MSPNELQELQSVAEALNAESNEINGIITALNEKLAVLNVGIEVWVGPWENSPYQIGYAKIETVRESSWQLATRSCGEIRQWVNEYAPTDSGIWEIVPGSEVGDPEPLLKAPRKLRIEGLEVMKDIIGELKTAANRSLKTIREAKAMAASL